MKLNLQYLNNTLPPKVQEFVINNHYSKSCRSMMQLHVFTLNDGMNLKGTAIYGKPMGRNCDPDFIELRRFCLAPGAEKNTASYFLSQTLRWLQRNELDFNRVLSYADPNKGHKGTIYLASNFQYDGKEKNGNPRIVMVGDKVVHLRQLYQKRNGEYDESALKLQAMVSTGEAQILKQEQKLRFIYKLRQHGYHSIQCKNFRRLLLLFFHIYRQQKLFRSLWV